MKILLLRTWINNIGNGFIDKGTRSALEEAFPQSSITEVSGFSNWASHNIFLPDKDKPISSAYSALERVIGDEEWIPESFDPTEISEAQNNTINIGEMMDADLAVLPGCILDPHVFERYKTTLIDIQDRGIPILLIGAGGMDYEPETVQYTKEVLQYFDPVGLITRDEIAYNHYSDDVDFAFNGIDSAFFIRHWYSPPSANQDFQVNTFDKLEEPDLKSSVPVIRPDHAPFHSMKVRNRGQFNNNNVFISDLLEDYLFLYANAQEVHTDRVHGGVPTLSYGGKMRFYYETPRGSLFNQFDSLDTASKKPQSIDMSELKGKEQEQVEAIESAVEESNISV